jgi:NAD+ synthase
MTDTLAVALAQINPTMGDLAGNAALILASRAEAAKGGADVVLFPELSIAGYPPEDLVLKPFFIDRVREQVLALAAATADGGPAMIVGAPWRVEEGENKGKIENSAFVLDGGDIVARIGKVHLPNYHVFDEMRVFTPAGLSGPVMVRGVRLGLMVCEDMWFEDVAECLEESGAEILVVPNGSPWERGKDNQRLAHAASRVSETGLPIIYLNLLGGQDELVFDGSSFVLNADHKPAVWLPAWQPRIMVTRWSRQEGGWHCAEEKIERQPEDTGDLYQAMVLALRDYVEKNRFPGVLIGMSGGIDSALSAAIAVDALGAEKVITVMMPSPYTSQDSLDDAAECSGHLGAALHSVAIEPAMQAFGAMLAPVLGEASDITAQNIQSRARGLTLMALSNQFGHMVLTTGNKSEMAVGYATLYGDMCGGFNALKDLYKMQVYACSHWRNQNHLPGFKGPAGRVIPERIITKAPSAELKPDQKDQDSLPPYEVLDDILECLVEHEMAVSEIIARGHDKETVNKVWRLLDRAEYKRRQSPPGVKLTARAFGKERRYPITNGFTSLL